MELKKISISGFCNIDKFDIAFSEFNALVAPNNYGKSNVLESIRFAFRFMAASESERNSMMRDAAFLPINNVTSGRPFSFGVALQSDNNTTYNYSFSFEWARNNGDDGAYITTELLTENSEEYRRPHTLIKRTEPSANKKGIHTQCDGGLYMSSVTSRCNKKAEAKGCQLVIDVLSSMDSLFYGSVIKALKNLEMNMVGVTGFDKQALCKFIYDLKNQEPMKYSLFEDAVTQIVPNIKQITPTCSQLGLAGNDVPFRIEDAIYDMRINEKSNNQDISISRLSSGSRRIITIIAEIMKAEMTGASLIAIEELENSVHPKLLENMILLVQAFAEGITVITTSHSPYLVRFLKSKQLTFGLPNDDSVASFHKLKPTKVKTVVKRASAMDLTLGEYMFELMLDMKADSEDIAELFE